MAVVCKDREAPKIQFIHFGGLALILSAALFVRLWNIGGPSFWGDEFLSAEVSAGHGYEHWDVPVGRVMAASGSPFDIASAGSWSATWDSLQRSAHPPLYFLVLRAWRTIGQFDDDASLRILSAMFSVIAVIFAFDAVRVQQRSSAAGLWVAAVLALANVQVQFAQEARGYALLCLFMLAACNAIIRIEHLGLTRTRLIGLAAAAMGMLLTHYLSVILCGLFAIYVVFQLPRVVWKPICLTLLACFGATLTLWGPTLWVQCHIVHERLGWLVQQPDNHAGTTLRRLLGWPINTLVNLGWRPGPDSYGAAILLVLPLLLVRKSPTLRLWTLLSLGELSLIALGDFATGTVALQFPRYTLPAATAAAILVPLIMRQLPGGAWPSRFAMGAILCSCAAGLPLSYQRDKPDYRELARFVERQCPRDSTIVFTGIELQDDPALMALALSRYFIDSQRKTVVLPARVSLGSLIPLSGSTIVDVVSDAYSAKGLIKGSKVLDAGFFPGIGSCTRMRLTPNDTAQLLTFSGQPVP